MRAGQLRHTIAIQERTPTADGMGGSTETWADVSGMEKVRADIFRLSSDEKPDADKLELQDINRVKIRYRPGITAKNRINWSDRSKVFNITSINNSSERNRMLIFKVYEDV